MGTDPKKPHDPDAARRPSGAESKHGPHADSGGSRSSSGSDYGDWVPDPGKPHPTLDDDSGGGDLMNVPRERGSPQSDVDRGQAGTTRTGVAGEDERLADEAEARAESNRNKDFDTTHVHSSTTSRKV
jgi:hypothetical protein